MSIFLSRTRRLPLPHTLLITASSQRYKHDTSTSEKLFEDAKRKEQEEKREMKRKEQAMNAMLTSQAGRNWDGDEPIADAILRMLVDKYKPLRSGTITAADEKLSKAAPAVREGGDPSESLLLSSEATQDEETVLSNRPLAYPKIDPSKPLKDQPLLPVVEGHRPWHTNFTAPSHATASVRIGNVGPVKPGRGPTLDEKARKKEKENNRRFETAFKLEGAKESVLDHRLGIKQQKRTQANPTATKGWWGLVEERIEVCLVVRPDSL